MKERILNKEELVVVEEAHATQGTMNAVRDKKVGSIVRETGVAKSSPRFAPSQCCAL